MKLQKQISRKTKKKAYVKWVVSIPEELINELDWKQGTTLQANIQENKLVFQNHDKTKVKIISPKNQKLSYYERFMLVYDNLPLIERKQPIAVIDNESFSWMQARNEIIHTTKLGKKIGELLIKLEII